MSEGVPLSRTARDQLARYLAEIEEKKEDLISQFYADVAHERQKLRDFLNQTTKKLSELIQRAIVVDDADDTLPFACIGSRVEVEDEGTGEQLIFCVVSPFLEEVGENDASYLSPIGRALAFKKPGERVEVRSPSGTFAVRIKKVTAIGP